MLAEQGFDVGDPRPPLTALPATAVLRLQALLRDGAIAQMVRSLE